MASDRQPRVYRDSHGIQAILQRQGIVAVKQNGVEIVRNDVKNDSAFLNRKLHSDIAICYTCQYPPLDSFTADLDGVPLVNSAEYSMGESIDSCGSNLQVGLYLSSSSTGYFDIAASELINGPSCPGGPTYGPVYSAPRPVQCAQDVATQVQALAKSLYVAGIDALKTTYGQAMIKVFNSAKAFVIDGTVSLEGFLDVLISALTFTTLAAVLDAFADGLTLGMILDYLWCLATGHA